MNINDEQQLHRGLLTKSFDPVNVTIAYYLVMIAVNSNLRAVMPGLLYFFVELGFYVLFINASPRFQCALNTSHVSVLIAGMFLFAISYIIAQDRAVHRQVFETIIRWGLPLFFLGAAIRDSEDLMRCMRIASILILICIVLGVFLLGTNGAIIYRYSQDTGYQVLIPFAAFLPRYLQERKKKSIIPVIIAGVLMLISGARGPLLAFILCFLIDFFAFTNLTSKSGVKAIIVIVLLVLIGFLFYDQLIGMGINTFSSHGFSTRILKGLQLRSIYTDRGRHALRSYAFDYALEHPFWGTGLVNDRRVLFDNLTVDTNKLVFGYYAHNIFAEICMQIGLVPGIIANLLLLSTVVSGLSRTIPYSDRVLTSFLLGIGFFPLLVSYSYLSYQYFYLLIGFSLVFRRRS